MDDQHFDLILKKSFHYLSLRSRTEQEMRNYLQKKTEKYNFKPEIIDKVIEYLKERNFINDKDFVEEYISSRLKSKPRSLFLLKRELSQKGISEENIETYLSENSVDEQAAAEKLLTRKSYTWANLPYLKKKKKTYDFLRTKGFNFDIIRLAFEKIFEGKS